MHKCLKGSSSLKVLLTTVHPTLSRCHYLLNKSPRQQTDALKIIFNLGEIWMVGFTHIMQMSLLKFSNNAPYISEGHLGRNNTFVQNGQIKIKQSYIPPLHNMLI